MVIPVLDREKESISHRTKRLAYYKTWKEANKDRIKLVRKLYSENNKEIIKGKKQAYYEDNKEKILKSHKQYQLDNRDKILAKKHVYYEENKKRILEDNKNYQMTHKLERHIHDKAYYAKKMQLESTFTIKQWENTKLYFNNVCCYCGKELPLQQEHVIPILKQGNYNANNIVPSCKNCNSRKGSKDFSAWYPKDKCYSKEREQKILKFLSMRGSSSVL